MYRRYARSLRGTRADGSAPVNYGDNISLIGAIRLDGITTAMTIAGAVDGARAMHGGFALIRADHFQHINKLRAAFTPKGV